MLQTNQWSDLGVTTKGIDSWILQAVRCNATTRQQCEKCNCEDNEKNVRVESCLSAIAHSFVLLSMQIQKCTEYITYFKCHSFLYKQAGLPQWCIISENQMSSLRGSWWNRSVMNTIVNLLLLSNYKINLLKLSVDYFKHTSWWHC